MVVADRPDMWETVPFFGYRPDIEKGRLSNFVLECGTSSWNDEVKSGDRS